MTWFVLLESPILFFTVQNATVWPFLTKISSLHRFAVQVQNCSTVQQCGFLAKQAAWCFWRACHSLVLEWVICHLTLAMRHEVDLIIIMIVYDISPFHRPVIILSNHFAPAPYLPRIRDAFLEHGCHADTRLWCVPWSIKLTVIERKNWSKLGKTCRTAGGDYWRLLYWTQMQRRVSALQRRRLLHWLRVVRVSPGGGRSNPAEVRPKAEEVTIGLLAWKIRHHTVIALEDGIFFPSWLFNSWIFEYVL